MGELTKGGNAPLAGGTVTMAVSVREIAADVSALLLSAGGKVRTDDDLVFYNHPSQDGVTVSGSVVTADLDGLRTTSCPWCLSRAPTLLIPAPFSPLLPA